MCGIAGAFKATGTVDSPTVPRMLDALAHRGPDGKGLWWRDDVALGHHRLAIHDLSSAGAQPMESADGRHVLVINGTIHNAPELRRDPACADYPFRGTSDSEVLLPLWAAYDVEMFGRLEGPFALAIWDSVERSLVLARDPYGKKPLFWTGTPETGIVFASELRALLEADIPRAYDPALAADYLRRGFVDNGNTVLSDIEQVPLAAWVKIKESKWKGDGYSSLRDGAATFDEALTDAVTRRTRTDRTLGVLLSGGLDSTTIAAIASRERGDQLQSFTMGFDDPRFDERSVAAASAKRLGITHHEWTFDVDPGPLLREMIQTTGELLADSSWLPTTLVCRRAKEHATVLLCGDGADELLFGYRRYNVARWSRRLGPARHLVRLLTPFVSGVRQRQGIAALARGPHAGYADLVGLLPEKTLAPWLHPDVRRRGDYGGPYGGPSCTDLWSYLPYDLLVKTDRASMISGIDVWTPFLDSEFHALLHRSEPHHTKDSLRRLLATMGFPDEFLSRRKQGFGVPLFDWLRTGSYGRFAREVLGDVKAPFEGVLAVGDALPILERVQAGDEALAPLAHACVVLALWWDAFMTGRS